MEICKICGVMVDVLTNNHCQSHGITRSQYRELHGQHLVMVPIQKRMSDADLYEMEMNRSLSKRR